jgi:hypothetical protein
VSKEPRSTTTRDQHRRAIRRTKPPCGIYLLHGPGEDECRIDYSLKWPDPMCFVVDHIVPLETAGTPEERAALDVLPNKQAAHNMCNREKWHKVAEDTAPRTFVTARTW